MEDIQAAGAEGMWLYTAHEVLLSGWHKQN